MCSSLTSSPNKVCPIAGEESQQIPSRCEREVGVGERNLERGKRTGESEEEGSE